MRRIPGSTMMPAKSLKEFGWQQPIVGFDADELDKLLNGEEGETLVEGETEPDAVPEVPEEAASVPGTVYQLGKHRLLCGDATKHCCKNRNRENIGFADGY